MRSRRPVSSQKATSELSGPAYAVRPPPLILEPLVPIPILSCTDALHGADGGRSVYMRSASARSFHKRRDLVVISVSDPLEQS